MCLVEIEMGGRRGLMPSCTAMPAEGMIVDTETDAVKHNQEAIMEFLLINHPLDCPVCDQAGESGFQPVHGGKIRAAEEGYRRARDALFGPLYPVHALYSVLRRGFWNE
jgi:NADH-quinone oxidoreductase subunit G